MNGVLPPGLQWAQMQAEHLEAVCALERRAHAHPWSEQLFYDSLHAGHQAQLLLCDGGTPAVEALQPALRVPDGRLLLGYFVAQTLLDEVHLYNLAVARARQGWGGLLLQRLVAAAQAQGAQTLWLEVRASNQPALALYRRAGFESVATRRGYYPAAGGAREDALVLRLCLQPLRLTSAQLEPAA
ncbi:MAG: ribosomal-protein-alanine N-acetyltransferase [Comamonadaceae bacterium]|nr:ribosomal-protein-alanine N-acetyltransferase [Comamonadaceae bacterium]